PYIRSEWVDKKRKKRSPIEPYGSRFVKLDREHRNCGEYWLCDLCDEQGITTIFSLPKGTTSGPLDHLRQHHGLLRSRTSSVEGSDSTDSEATPRPQKSQRTLQESLRKAVMSKSTGQTFRDTLLGWISKANIPFSGIEHPLFRQLLCLLNKNLVQELLPLCGDTVKSWLNAEVESQKGLLKTELAAPPYKKHLSFDLWTSSNQYALLGITVHFVSASQQLQSRFLALKRVLGSHGGENLGPVLQSVIEDFAISETLGYLTADNADSCDGAVTELFCGLSAAESATDEISELSAQRRIRCVNHQINLIATGFLGGSKKEALRKLDPHSEEYKSLLEEIKFLEDWRQSSAIQRLHNLMSWIRRSPQRRERFLDLTYGTLTEEELLEFGQVLWNLRDLGGLMVKQDNDTRWNAFLASAERAMKLKDPIEVFQRALQERDAKRRLPAEYVLHDDDWSFLAIAVEILTPCQRLTKLFESRAPHFAEVAASLYYLLDHFLEKKKVYADGLVNQEITGPKYAGRSILIGDEVPVLRPTTPLESQSQRPQRERRLPGGYGGCAMKLPGTIRAAIMCESGDSEDPTFSDDKNLHALLASLSVAIFKIEKYIATLDHSPAYWAAMILHPGLKKRWIEKNLDEEHAQHVFSTFTKFFEDEYNKLDLRDNQPVDQAQPSYLIDDDFYDKPEDLTYKDELTSYFSGPLLPVKGPLEWWRQHQDSLPRLAKMAFDILSIPATSCECERTFSHCKLAVSTQRHSLKDLTIEKLICLKFWLGNEAI
ncbi:hat family dimerization, partial [Fusarium mundagurra]